MQTCRHKEVCVVTPLVTTNLCCRIAISTWVNQLASIVEVSNLTHIYRGGHKALEGLSFSVGEGEIVGLLGPNGAGKSTTVKLITGILRPTSGSVRVAGQEVSQSLDAVRRLIGFMPQETALYQDLTAYESLEYHAELYGVSKSEVSERIKKMLELAGLTHRKDDLVKTYSGGMKRRLALVRSILHDSKLLILDEMSLGVDVQSRNLIWNQVRKMKKEGRTVLFCTNYMDEAEALADRVIVIDNGRLVATGSPVDLKREYIGDYLIEVLIEGLESAHGSEWLTEKIKLDVEKVSEPLNGGPRTAWIRSQAGPSDLPLVINRLSENDLVVKQASMREPSLGDVFLAITGSTLRD
ncbi:MAG: ABC transporter ATP-binding protein [Candidatus Thorarchaeota archaeon]|nr:ABC transporter ATP-binding protein [Candidatus Thorarchaeota archaeon]